MFAVSAGIIGLGFFSSLRITGDSAPDAHKRRFYFRKKYAKYYMLEVFYGARKQVFFTFGPYVLVLFYGANAMVISALFGGWIWKAVGIETLFILSAVLGLCNSAYAATIRTGKQ